MLFQLRNCFHLIKLTQVKTSFVALNLQYRIANCNSANHHMEEVSAVTLRSPAPHHHIEVATITMEVDTITMGVATITKEDATITWRSPTSH